MMGDVEKTISSSIIVGNDDESSPIAPSVGGPHRIGLPDQKGTPVLPQVSWRTLKFELSKRTNLP
jgi:hypothetical protein